MKKLEELGEFGLIDRIKSQTSLKNTTTFVGIGDDAAVIDQGSHYSLLSTDLMVEGVHFDLAYHPLKHLGYKAVAVNVSDIAAMNGIPKQITVSIAISNRFGLAAVDELYEGIRLGCEAYNVDLVGGDTTASRAGIVISVSVLGEVTKDKLVLRSGSRENDILCVTGDLGAAYMGVQVLEREKQEFLANPNMQPQLENKSYLVGKQLKPDARMDIIHELAEKGVVPTSMMDISDGLASEILHLSKASGNGFTVFFDNIPIENITLETSTEFNINPVVAVVNGGEDYELLMTIKQEDYENIKGILDLTPIGFVNNEKMNWLVLNSGEKTEIKAPGWK